MLKPYDGYKETSYDWLEEVPIHWNKIALRSITKLSESRNRERENLELLSVYREYGVIKKSSRDDNHNVESLDLSNYKYVGKGYLVINKMKLWQGSLGVSKYEGIVSPAYIVCRTLGDFSLDYLQFLLRSPFFKTYYNRISKGIRVGQWDSNYEELKKLYVFLPPRTEQEQIVKYLDWQTSKINILIKAKKKQIELLKEQKQAVINKAVTKGLDDTVPMKDSGIEWLGDMPDGWYIRPFHKVATVKSNLVHPNDFQDFIQVSPANIEKDTGKLLNCGTVKEAGIISDNHYFYEGQILYSKIRPLLNKVTIAPCNGLCSADMYPIETILETKFLVFYMLSKIYLSQISMSGNRVKMPKINKEELSTVLILFPDTKQQQAIVTYLEEKTALIDKAIAVIEKEIELVNEYKTSLISSVVTGKVDVRDVVVPEFQVVEEVEEEIEVTVD